MPPAYHPAQTGRKNRLPRHPRPQLPLPPRLSRPNQYCKRFYIRSTKRIRSQKHTIQHRPDHLLHPLHRLRDPLQHPAQEAETPRLAISMHVPLRRRHYLPGPRAELLRPPRHPLFARSR